MASPQSGNIASPFGIAVLPTSMFYDLNRHGSAEQDARGDSYLDSMGGRTPSRPTTPRSPRARSPEDDDDQDRREERRERRDDRRRREEQPVGVDQRLRACESSLRDHQNELAAQRLSIAQMTEAFHQYTKDKEETGKKLDWVFAEFEKKVIEEESFRKELQERHNHVLSTINEMIPGISQQFEKLRAEMSNDQLRKELAQQLDPVNAELHRIVPLIGTMYDDIVRLKDQKPTGPPPGRAAEPPTTVESAGFGRPPPSFGAQPKMPQPEPTNTESSGYGFGRPPPNFGAPPRSNVYTSQPEQMPQNDMGGGARQGFGDQRFPQPNFGEPSSHVPKSPPQPSQQFARSAEYYNVGSPLNPDSQFGNWAPGAGTQYEAFNPKDWSTDGRKVTKELKAFDGQMIHFDNWRRRIRDHFISVNCNYAKIFELAEKAKTPIHWDLLRTTDISDLPYVNWPWIATHIWTFTSAYLTDSQLLRRTTLTLGQEFNGLELWRALYMENCGGSAEMVTTERSFFIDFPKCERATDLQNHLGTWVQLKQKYGVGLPAEHQIHMFHKILPDEVREELKRQRDLKNDLQRQIDFVYSELGSFIDNKLSKWNISKLQQQIKTKTTGVSVVGTTNSEPVGPAAPVSEVRQGDTLAPPIPDLAAFNANLERMINAAVARGHNSDSRGRDSKRSPANSRSGSNDSKRGDRRSPNPRFDGCWCCGSKDHSRAACPEFIAIKKKNDGKIPRDYQGAYEKSLKKKSTSLKVVACQPVVKGAEFPETLSIWPMLSMPPPRPPIPMSNKFRALTEDDRSDDESEVMHELTKITPNVQRASDKARSQKEKKFGRPSHIARLNAVAKSVLDGTLSLPEVDLETDEEYDYVWCLVDSGAGANVARKDHFPNSVPCDAPAISLTVANGVHMPNSGARRVVSYNKDGTKVERIFYEADVEMPILSVAELSDEGECGAEVRFLKRDGYIEDIQTGRRCLFVKLKGVYFVKLYVPKGTAPKCDQKSGFARPA